MFFHQRKNHPRLWLNRWGPLRSSKLPTPRPQPNSKPGGPHGGYPELVGGWTLTHPILITIIKHHKCHSITMIDQYSTYRSTYQQAATQIWVVSDPDEMPCHAISTSRSTSNPWLHWLKTSWWTPMLRCYTKKTCLEKPVDSDWF